MIGSPSGGEPAFRCDGEPPGDDAVFRTVFDQAAMGMAFVTLDGDVITANRHLGEMLGYAPNELAGHPCSDFTHPDDIEEEHRTIARLREGPQRSSAWEKRYLRRDGSTLWGRLTMTVLCDDGDAGTQFLAMVEDVTERHSAIERLERNDSLLRIAGRAARLGGYDYDHATGRLALSDEACAIHDVAPGSVATLAEAIAHYRDGEALRLAIERCRETGEAFDMELERVPAGGETRTIRIVGQTGTRPDVVVGAVQDVTERSIAAFELRRTNRALTLLGRCNEIVVRANDEGALLADLCDLVVGEGGYGIAWIGYARDDAARTIEPMAASGDMRRYFGSAHISWGEEVATGRGGAGRTIRTGIASVIEDIEHDPGFTPWIALARAVGARSVIALPLRDAHRTFGALCLYGTETSRPAATELNLLQQLADDLAFGIGHIRSQVEQRRVQEAVLKISSAVSVRADPAFFESLVRHLIETVGADSAFISQPSPAHSNARRTLVAIVDGAVVPNFDYSTDHTPSAHVRADSAYVVPSGFRALYPRCALGMMTGGEAFVGWRLESSTGDSLAMMTVFFRTPLDDYDFTTSTMKIFVARASAELERQRADAKIADQASWLDEARDAIVVRNVDGRISFWNRSAERLYGWTPGEACGAALDDSLFADGPALRDATVNVYEHGFWNGELDYRRRDGSFVRVESHWTIVRDGEGRPRSILSIDTDITERKAAEREIEHLAFYDTLTNLPNRPLLIERLRAALTTGTNVGALLFIDLDNFKTLNDTLGHDQGDLLLRQVAERVTRCVRAHDTVARLGGDEFVVLLPDVGTTPEDASHNARAVAQTIAAAFNAPYHLGEYEHDSTPSIGVTLFTRDDTMEDLLKQADLAMYQAKAAGRNAIRFFDPHMQATVTARRGLEDDLRTAIRARAFFLAYQPQLDDRSNIIGAEALVRWTHERRGPIPPIEFISIAEDSGLIVPLGRQILRMACERLVAWSGRSETSRLALSVNVSVREFRHADFIESVLAVLDETGADPTRLKLELTETVFADDIDVVIAKMDALKAIGVGFSLDDFGTGYSSLSYLKRLPLDQLKIDQSFVRDVLVDVNDAVIARTIVALARNLGIDVIAEGVESQGQRDFLIAHGCRAFQGYFFSRPLAPDVFEAFARERAGRSMLAGDRTGTSARIGYDGDT